MPYGDQGHPHDRCRGAARGVAVAFVRQPVPSEISHCGVCTGCSMPSVCRSLFRRWGLGCHSSTFPYACSAVSLNKHTHGPHRTDGHVMGTSQASAPFRASLPVPSIPHASHLAQRKQDISPYVHQPNAWASHQHQQAPAALGYPPAHSGYGVPQAHGCTNFVRHAPPHEYEYGPHRPSYDTTVTWNAPTGAVEQSVRPCADCARSQYRVCAQHPQGQQPVATHHAPPPTAFNDYSNAYGSLRTPSVPGKDHLPTGPQSHMYPQHRPEQQLPALALHPDPPPSYHHTPSPFPFPPTVSQHYHPQHHAHAQQQTGAHLYATESHPILSGAQVVRMPSVPSRPPSQLNYRPAEPPGGISALADVACALLREEIVSTDQASPAVPVEASDPEPGVTCVVALPHYCGGLVWFSKNSGVVIAEVVSCSRVFR